MNAISLFAAHLLPVGVDWNTKLVVVPSLNVEEKEDLTAKLLEIASNKKDHIVSEAELIRLFDACEPAIAEKDVIGRSFRGRIIRTGTNVFDLAELTMLWPMRVMGINWNKRFFSMYKGDAFVFDWQQFYYFPIFFNGVASITDQRWRNQVTATVGMSMNQVRDPLVKLVDTPETTILLGNAYCEKAVLGWFTLTLDKAVNIAD